MAPFRVAIVASHPIQHFGPLYAALSERQDIDLRVGFSSSSGVDPYFDRDFGREVSWGRAVLQGYKSSFFAGAASRSPRSFVWPRSVWRFLSLSNPDAVLIYGLRRSYSVWAVLWAKGKRRKVMLVTDAELVGGEPRIRSLRRRLTLPVLLRLVDSALAVGDKNETYYRTFGMRSDQIFRCPFPVDSRQLSGTPGPIDVLRAAWGFREGVPLAIVVGKLTALKMPSAILAALRELPGDVALDVAFIGDGPDRPTGSDLQVGGEIKVITTGFVQPSELRDFYAAAQFLIHVATQDHHPLAISEAVYCGLPIICSNNIGSVGPTDDVQPGRNGYVFPIGNTTECAALIALLAQSPELRNELASRSREIGQMHSLERVAAGYVLAVEKTLV